MPFAILIVIDPDGVTCTRFFSSLDAFSVRFRFSLVVRPEHRSANLWEKLHKNLNKEKLCVTENIVHHLRYIIGFVMRRQCLLDALSPSFALFVCVFCMSV